MVKHGTWCTWISGTWSNIYLFLRSFHHFFCLIFDINPYFCHIFVKPGPFWHRDTEPGILNDADDHYCIIPSTCYPFHLLFFCPIVFKWHFWHPGQWFDGSPNLGSSFWMNHYDLQPVTCQLPPATCYLWHLWRQKQVAWQRLSEGLPLLLLSWLLEWELKAKQSKSKWKNFSLFSF